MGCASSKEKVCKNCQAAYSPMRRSSSVHVHHPPQKTGDSYHLVALTSSTLGSLKLDPLIQIEEKIHDEKGDETPLNRNLSFGEDRDKDKDGDKDEALFGNEKIDRKKSEFAMGMIEAKTWSTMINEKIPKIVPKTPIRTPPGEPETINAWEMMEGLEDISPLRSLHFRSFSFNVPTHPTVCDQPTPRVKENVEFDSVDTDSTSNSNSNSNDTIEFDPEVIATFRKALEELPPANPFHLKPIDNEKGAATNEVVPRGRDKLIVYFTSLRGVRKTYEDCCHVVVILKGLGVKVDERDVSMHSGFKEELKGLGGSGLPRVFLGKKYIGGAEEIRRLNEEGKLEKLVENCELVDDGGGGHGFGNANVCEACGDIRFVPCETCSGSCKIYYEGDYDEEEEVDESENEVGFHRCPDCNENGLIRCPICCD